ncbi:MAG: tetratricopeptide repeat protein [Candidatus Latescibacteria bacterium]|nr:tetratricopeptide repeat protein [Candidatus Latescibacterota bacterium]
MKSWIGLRPAPLFAALLCVYGLVIVMTFWDYGITVDEEQHVLYGRSVVDWYLSGFKDRWMFTWVDVWLYGGFYDMTSYLATRISPFDLYDTRHLCNALFGVLGIWGAYRLGCLLGSGWVGLLAAAFLILTPRYYGHAFNNHKDFPFAVLYLWSLCWQVKVLKALPRVPWRWVIITGIVTGLAMGIRVGGVLLVCYMGLFWLLRYMQVWWHDRQSIRNLAMQYAGQMGVAFGVAYGVMLLFWPWAQTGPLTHPFKALTAFSKFHNVIINYFEGQYVPSNQVPWYFAPKWMLLTLPEFVLLGLLVGAGIVVWRRREIGTVLVFGLVCFAALFPLIYTSVMELSLYNGSRHVLFILPPVVVLSAVSIFDFTFRLTGWRQLLFGGVIVGLMGLALIEMVALHPYQSMYFNRVVAGGFEQASQEYDTDYWHNAYKEGFRWLRDHVAEEAPDKPFRISSQGGNMPHQVKNTSFVHVANPWDADYHLASANHHGYALTPGRVLHTVRRREVPLLYVIEPDSSYIHDPLFDLFRLPFKDQTLALFYENTGQTEPALASWRRAIKNTPERSFPYARLGRWYVHLKNHDLAAPYLEKALEIGPPQTTWYFLLGRCYQISGEFEKSISVFEKALAMRPNYLGALRGLGESYLFLGNYMTAILYLEQVLVLAPNSSYDYRQLATAHYFANQMEEAIGNYRKSISLDSSNVKAHFGLGLALHRLGMVSDAETAYLQTLKRDPNH